MRMSVRARKQLESVKLQNQQKNRNNWDDTGNTVGGGAKLYLDTHTRL